MKKLECPYCGFIKVSAGRALRKYRKKLSGFTCTNCGEKVSGDVLTRKKGRGPKPKGERRKRSKKEEVKETPIIVAPQPHIERIEWKTRDSLPLGQSRNPDRRDYTSWQSRGGGKPLQPMNRSMGEATMVSLGIRPSAPIPHSNYMEVNGELEKLKEERQALEGIREKLGKQEKKLVLIVTRLDRAEERIDANVRELGAEAESLNSLLTSLSTLISRMENLLSYYEVRQR